MRLKEQEVTTKGSGGKDCEREGVIYNMYVLFRPKFWENLTSPLFGTLSPPSETSEVSYGEGGRDCVPGRRGWAVETELEKGIPPLSKQPACFLQ